MPLVQIDLLEEKSHGTIPRRSPSPGRPIDPTPVFFLQIRVDRALLFI